MQTAGTIHALCLEQNAEEMAVPSKGRYLACGLPAGSVEVWEVASKMEGGQAIWTSSRVINFCLLGLEERLAVSTDAPARIWDTVAGTVLHSYTIRYPVRSMVYYQKLNRLATMASSVPGRAVTIVNRQTSSYCLPLHWVHKNLSSFVFSQTTEELVFNKQLFLHSLCASSTRAVFQTSCV